MPPITRTEVPGWKLAQYSGYERRDTSVDFDGEGIEVEERVSGYSGYTSTTYISMDLLRALLAQHGYRLVKD